jgi:hypothetical protein
MKRRLFILLFIASLVIILGRGRTTPISASQQKMTEINSVYLPFISRGTEYEYQSPFWVEIAVISQIWRDSMQVEDAMSDTEWMTYLEESFPTLIAALKDIGTEGTRIYFQWKEVEPTQPILGTPRYDREKWDWYDERLGQLGEAGLEIIVTIAETPSWAADPPCGPLYSYRLDEYARFLSDLVNRYKLPPYNVKYWEIMNEPDSVIDFGGGFGCFGDFGSEYAQTLSVASQAIKAADPDAVVLQGGIAYDWFTEYDGPFNRYFSDDVMSAGGGDYFDVLNFHYFPDFHEEWERWDPNSEDRQNGWLEPPTCGDYFDGLGQEYEAGGIDLIAKASHYVNRMSTCFSIDKPVWVTEISEHGYEGNPGSLAQQARYVIQGNVRGLAAGVEKLVWFALVTPNNIYEQGLLYDDFSPKPAFYAYKTLISELEGFDYSQTLDVEDVEAYVFESSIGDEKVVAWGNNTFTFTSVSQLRVVDRDGTVTWITDGGPGDLDGTQNNYIVIQISSEPVFIQPF